MRAAGQVFRPVQWFALAAVFALLGGCGGKAPYSMVRITAKVTYTDGTPIPGDRITVMFHPQVEAIDAKTHARPVTAYADKDGTIAAVTTWQHNDGLAVGKHKVTVVSATADNRPTGAVPAIYADPKTTPLEIEVSSNNKSFELTVEKPSKPSK